MMEVCAVEVSDVIDISSGGTDDRSSGRGLLVRLIKKGMFLC